MESPTEFQVQPNSKLSPAFSESLEVFPPVQSPESSSFPAPAGAHTHFLPCLCRAGRVLHFLSTNHNLSVKPQPRGLHLPCCHPASVGTCSLGLLKAEGTKQFPLVGCQQLTHISSPSIKLPRGCSQLSLVCQHCCQKHCRGGCPVQPLCPLRGCELPEHRQVLLGSAPCDTGDPQLFCEDLQRNIIFPYRCS